MASLRKRTAKLITYDDYDDNDEPLAFQSSGDEWMGEELEEKRGNRRKSTRGRKKARYASSSDSSEVEAQNSKRKSNNKTIINSNKDVKPKSEPVIVKVDSSPKKEAPKTPPKVGEVKEVKEGKSYSTGSFLINKKDAQKGDPEKPPCLWRVDGKALLQKYEPYEEDDKIRHKTSSTYTGWSTLDSAQYAQVTVKVVTHSNQSMVVEMDWDQLKNIKYDTD